MNEQPISIKSQFDDLILHGNIYTCAQPKAIVQIIHGMSEHKERYDQFANVLASFGCIVIIADNRGHGQSVNENVPLGYFAKKNGWMVNLQDIHLFSMQIREMYPHLPFFVMGHSMGSLIAHSYLKRYEDMVDGIIFSGMPAYNKSVGSGKFLASILSSGKKDKKVSKTLAKAADFNKYLKKPQTKFDWISYNQDNVNEYISDPLCGFPFTSRGYYDLFDGMQDVYVRKDWRVLKTNLPIFFVVGQDDVCADVASGFKRALNNLASVGYKNIEANIYENMRHEILNEKQRKVVFTDLLVWLNKQISLINEKEKTANNIEPEQLEDNQDDISTEE
ncbi:MAG: alpha/beta fold hydrolase [Erysipelotrichaceae bacterium]